MYVELAEEVFPKLWVHICNLRNVKGNRTDAAKALEQGKRRQVLLQILMLRRMRNQQSLLWWSMIQAVAYYGWGVGNTALNATNYWGMACSSRSRDRAMQKRTECLVERRTRFFSDRDAITFCMDNYQVGQHVLHQRSGRRRLFLKGTHQMAHEIRPFTNTDWDKLYSVLSYTHDQDYPSPLLMPKYEDATTCSDAFV